VSSALLNPIKIETQTKFIVIFPSPTAATNIGLLRYPIKIMLIASISIKIKLFRIEGIIILNIILNY